MHLPRSGFAASLSMAALAFAGCGGGDKDGATTSPAATTAVPAPTTAAPTTAAPAPKPAATGTRITLRGSDYGKILFDGRGQAIYLFEKEQTSKPECYGECADAWPPVYTKGTPRAGSGIAPGLLGVTRRSDGRSQVTYNGHPLYFYAHEGTGEVRCQNVFLNGGKWLVVTADGKPVT